MERSNGFQLERTEGVWRVRHVLREEIVDDVRSDPAALRLGDEELVQLGRDYVEAFYGGAPQGEVMTWPDAERIAKNAFARGRPESEIAATHIVARRPGSAVMRLAAVWGIDEFTLVKTAQGWRIAQILWQSWPTEVGINLPGLGLKLAIRATGSISAKPIAADSLALYCGQIVGFCKPGCRDQFIADPKSHFGSLPELVR